MDVIWFIAGLVIGLIVGALMGYCSACLSILRKTSVREWDREREQRERDNESHE